MTWITDPQRVGDYFTLSLFTDAHVMAFILNTKTRISWLLIGIYMNGVGHMPAIASGVVSATHFPDWNVPRVRIAVSQFPNFEFQEF